MKRNLVLRSASSSSIQSHRSAGVQHFLRGKTPLGYWKDVKNQRAYLEWFAQQRGYKSLDDFYSLTSNELRQHGTDSLLFHYERSLHNALPAIFPEHTWLPWKFHASKGWWKDITNQKKFVEWFGSQNGVKHLDDWYNITMSQIKSESNTLCDIYGSSIFKMMKTLFPDHNWLPWKFVGIGKFTWKSPQTCRHYLEHYAPHLGVTKMEDWYLVHHSKITEAGNTNIMNHFNNSTLKLLRFAFPEYDWKPWKFASCPKSWGNATTVAQFLAVLAEQLHIEKLDDWYRVSHKQLIALKAGGIVRQYGSLYNLLKEHYPHYPWERQRFNDKGKRSAQRWLRVMLQKVFPQQEILEDYQFEPGEHKTTPISLDIYIPSLSLAFEYQGEQHYHNITFFSPTAQYKARDEAKKVSCNNAGILLVEVPFWWDKTRRSLLDFIKQATRSDSKSVIPASSLNTINSMIQQQESVTEESIFRPGSSRGKQKKTVKRTLMLAEDWDTTQDPTNWLLTEKYDGIRAYWDGAYLYSRTGSRISTPISFTKGWPGVHMDGELWLGYGKMEDLLSLMKTPNLPESAWKDVKFMVFDTPELVTNYEHRAKNLKHISEDFPANLKPVLPVPCEGRDHLDKYLKSIVDKGGEGVVLRDPKSLYAPGRSATFLKLKPFQEAEVRVLRSSNTPTEFTILCEQTNGLHCTVRCDGDVAKNPPAVGTVVTVQHSGYWDNGRMKYPFFWRVAHEKTWEDLLNEAKVSDSSQ